ncbi:hypothetical protein IWQ61_003773 [Dispira simplex]|nr:hypothetical protein IWQ61_003773 [Dispira simplex]
MSEQPAESCVVVESQLQPTSTTCISPVEFTLQHETWSNEAFILRYPRGVYSTARTLQRWWVIDFQGHIQRLCNSLCSVVKRMSWTDRRGRLLSMLADEVWHSTRIASAKELGLDWQDSLHLDPAVILFLRFNYDEEILKRVLTVMLQHGLVEFLKLPVVRSAHGEVKLTFVLTFDEQTHTPRCAIRIGSLQQLPISSCKVQVFPALRENPSAKDSQWVRDRQRISNAQLPDVNEVLLWNSQSDAIYEGMSSNFFVVQSISSSNEPVPPAVLTGEYKTLVDGHFTQHLHVAKFKLITAPPGSVLLGTIMKLVLKVCEENHIPVEYRYPTLSEARNGRWCGAFITSTSRLVLPIDIICIREHGQSHEYRVPESETVEFIRNEVRCQLMKTAVRIEHPDSIAS